VEFPATIFRIQQIPWTFEGRDNNTRTKYSNLKMKADKFYETTIILVKRLRGIFKQN
jgi:hypothetical protein